MAAAQGQAPLWRWKRFLPAFASIDAAIEAADPGLSSSRAEVRDARRKIVDMLRGATATDDAAVAEELCTVLDGVMVESLLTLEMVPAMPRMLATTDLALDVAALRSHDSERVRALATGVVRGWRASVKAELARAAAAMEKLSQALEPDEADADHHHAKILAPPAPKKTATNSSSGPPSFPKKQSAPAVLGGGRVKTANTDPPPPRENLPAAAVGSIRSNDDEKDINAAKRKLREGYKDAEAAKRRRTVKVIEAPADMAKKQQQQRKRHPILQQRDRSRYPSSTSLRPTRV